MFDDEVGKINVWCHNNNLLMEDLREKKKEIENLNEQVKTVIAKNETEPVYVGIDFGASKCSISVIERNEVKLIDLDDGCLMPSIVSFEKNILVGNEAKKRISNEKTIFHVKQFLGRAIDDKFRQGANFLPFKVNTKHDRVIFEIPHEANGNENVNAEEVASIILMKLKLNAEYCLNKSVANVSITVPAHFTATQRRATYNAALTAGFQDIHLVNDNDALIFTHLMESSSTQTTAKEITVVTISMGLAYFNISVATVKNNCFDISAVWNENIGGRDFDRKLRDLLNIDYKQKHSLIRTLILGKCEQAKIKLSSDMKTEIELHNLSSSFENFAITRQEYEACCETLFFKIKQLITEAMKHAITLGNEVAVILGGAATKMPQIRNMLIDLNVSYCSDHDFSRGAAIHCAHMNNDKLRESTVKNKIYFGYKFEANNSTVYVDSGTCLPCKKSFDVFVKYSLQRSLEMKIIEREFKNRRIYNETKIFSSSIGLAKKGTFGIKGEININESGLLHVNIYDNETKETKKFYLNNEVTSEIIETMKKSVSRRLTCLVSRNEKKKQLIYYLNGFLDMIHEIKLNTNKHDVDEIKRSLLGTLEWLNSYQQANEIENKQNEIAKLLNEILEYTNVKNAALNPDN
ncbi:molecular chaperone Hsp70-like protein [Leptotrombidium deliense]|uniref:Molecular chaperone Hsp70-like protein n=1 Tax=Leptotrombidium deliense TaxID=299467 RepID=A0A443S7B7_9ACAR|nr:molecular chaperone Hsp70-like protein [Leptotrombidium deliense]